MSKTCFGGAGASVGVFLFVTETDSRWGKTVLVQVDDSLLPQGGASKSIQLFNTCTVFYSDSSGARSSPPCRPV